MAIRETNARHEALGLDEDDLRRMHYNMLLARRVDERSWILNRQGKAAFVISCQGQEGCQVGAAYTLRPGHDYVYPYYRDHGIVLTLGMSAGDGERPGLQDARRGWSRARLRRRGLHQPGRLARGDEFRRHPRPARRLPH